MGEGHKETVAANVQRFGELLKQQGACAGPYGHSHHPLCNRMRITPDNAFDGRIWNFAHKKGHERNGNNNLRIYQIIRDRKTTEVEKLLTTGRILHVKCHTIETYPNRPRTPFGGVPVSHSPAASSSAAASASALSPWRVLQVTAQQSQQLLEPNLAPFRTKAAQRPGDATLQQLLTVLGNAHANLVAVLATITPAQQSERAAQMDAARQKAARIEQARAAVEAEHARKRAALDAERQRQAAQLEAEMRANQREIEQLEMEIDEVDVPAPLLNAPKAAVLAPAVAVAAVHVAAVAPAASVPAAGASASAVPAAAAAAAAGAGPSMAIPSSVVPVPVAAGAAVAAAPVVASAVNSPAALVAARSAAVPSVAAPPVAQKSVVVRVLAANAAVNARTNYQFAAARSAAQAAHPPRPEASSAASAKNVAAPAAAASAAAVPSPVAAAASDAQHEIDSDFLTYLLKTELPSHFPLQTLILDGCDVDTFVADVRPQIQQRLIATGKLAQSAFPALAPPAVPFPPCDLFLCPLLMPTKLKCGRWTLLVLNLRDDEGFLMDICPMPPYDEQGKLRLLGGEPEVHALSAVMEFEYAPYTLKSFLSVHLAKYAADTCHCRGNIANVWRRSVKALWLHIATQEYAKLPLFDGIKDKKHSKLSPMGTDVYTKLKSLRQS